MEANKISFKKDLVARLFSSIVLINLALCLNYVGSYFFLIAILIVNVILLTEYYRLFDEKLRSIDFIINILFGLLLIVLVFIKYYTFFFFTVTMGIILSSYFSKIKTFIVVIPYFYFFIPLSVLVYLNSYPDGKIIIYWIYIVVWTVDIAGYIFGKLFQGPKLIPVISPNKTWSGLIGGLLLSGLFSALYAYKLGHVQPSNYFVFGLLGGVFSVLGDLFESKLKRINNKKDASDLIPGHGGLLDRLDGFLFAILYFYILSYI